MKMISPFFGFALAFLFAIALNGAEAAKAPGAGGAPAMPKIFVNVGKVGLTENIVKHRYTAHVLSPARVDLVARISGELMEVNFEEGSFVKEGQVMYVLDDVQYDAAVKSAEANLLNAKAKAEYAKQTFERAEDLYKKQVSSKDAYDNAYSTYTAANATVAASEAALITAKDHLDDTRIISPINGKVGTTHYTKGNYITPSSGILATVIQQDPLRVRFSISNHDFLKEFGNETTLKEKGEVVLTLSDGSTYPETGKIIITENEANASADTLVIYALFNNPDYKLLPGSTVVATLQYKVPGQVAFIVPSALMNDGTASYVYVLGENNIPQRRVVVPGAQSGAKQIILEGLSEGETVVTDGMLKVIPGVPVEPVEEGAK